MAAINTRVVRRTHALKQYPYGDQFRYQEGTDCGPGIKGYAKGCPLLLGKLGMGFVATRIGRRLILSTEAWGGS